ncbi:ornithine decarboxylase 1-like [Toxorhynchites rutilus septentrionalis]|uniref:ornithine decarboxylase 1-like n=1 Tax=Toxorhynchites rutilus septentrionalis TaxID=329112 RepID=UPI00247AB747|nr:ornithine decarboxylase 1-like [Toxorhynchites rutilus septentrionalis]
MSVSEKDRSFTLLEANQSIAGIVEDRLSQFPVRDVPFQLLDLDDIVAKHMNWGRLLPRVKPFYAVKCNDDGAILETLAMLGTGFDCASKWEIEKVLDMGVEPERIIFAHPIKSSEALLFAKKKGVSSLTFDNELELEKIALFYPEAHLVLRIRYDSDNALILLGKKFGCDAQREGPQLIRKAKQLKLNIVGVSFHVGCGSLDADCFYSAIGAAKVLFEYAKTLGYKPSLLDIGGGFPGDSDKPIDEFALAINRALDHFFPNLDGVNVIAEPGRYYVGSAVRLLSAIHGKKIIRSPTDDSEVLQVMYYINDGVFGTLFDWVSLRAIKDLARVVPVITDQKAQKPRLKTTFWGPTCDSTDIICENEEFPEHDIGEYVLFENLGAYGMSFATNFNGFPNPTVEIYARKDTWDSLLLIKEVCWKKKTLDFLQKYF